MPRHTPCGNCFKDVSDEIPPSPRSSTETNRDVISVQKPALDTESTVSSSPEEPITTQEARAYPAITV